MNTDLSALRRDAETLEDLTLRDEALNDLAGLENAEVDLKKRLAEINREHWEKHYSYKPQTKLRLTSFAIFGLLAVIAMTVLLSEMLHTGSYTLSRTQYIITADANPIAYWLYAVGIALGIVLFIVATLFCTFAFLRHPHQPFKWMSGKRTF